MARKNRSEDDKPKRKPFQKKTVKEGHKSMRNVPEKESELKITTTFSITPTGLKLLQEMAEKIGCSVSSIFEDIARSRLILIPRQGLEESKEHLELKGLALNYELIEEKPEENENNE